MARGRPQNPQQQEQTRLALKQAARTLLAQKPYRSISIRELATQAGTQSAMVSYYFSNKEGLFISLLEDSSARRADLLKNLQQQLQAGQQLSKQSQPGGHHVHILALLIDKMLDMILSEPWLIQLMRDEVMSSESALRQHFIEVMPQRLIGGLLTLLKTLQHNGEIDPQLNTEFAATTVFSNVFFPLIAAPIVTPLLAVSPEVVASDAWRSHVKTMVLRALGASGISETKTENTNQQHHQQPDHQK